MTVISRRMALLHGPVAGAVATMRSRLGGAAEPIHPALPIPPEVRPDASGTIMLDIQPGTMQFLPNRRTRTYGVNGPFLGPAVRVRRGQTVVAKVTNSLAEDTTLHWHG